MNNRFSFGHAISKGNNNDIYVAIGDEHGDFLVGGTVRGENFSKNVKQSYNRDMFSEMAVYHFQLTETAKE